MGKSDRIIEQLRFAEADYEQKLLAALRICAGGVWGLFGQNEHLSPGQPTSIAATELLDLGSAIDEMRARIGEAPFALNQKFAAARGRQSPNQIGEPKLAKQWLAELGAS